MLSNSPALLSSQNENIYRIISLKTKIQILIFAFSDLVTTKN